MKNGRPAAPRALGVQFWEGIRSGLGIQEAGRAAGVGQEIAFRWFKQAGGVKSNGPRPACGRYLSVAEREEIAIGLAAGEPVRAIAARLGRSPSTISREVRRDSRARGVIQPVAVLREAATAHRQLRSQSRGFSSHARLGRGGQTQAGD